MVNHENKSQLWLMLVDHANYNYLRANHSYSYLRLIEDDHAYS